MFTPGRARRTSWIIVWDKRVLFSMITGHVKLRCSSFGMISWWTWPMVSKHMCSLQILIRHSTSKLVLCQQGDVALDKILPIWENPNSHSGWIDKLRSRRRLRSTTRLGTGSLPVPLLHQRYPCRTGLNCQAVHRRQDCLSDSYTSQSYQHFRGMHTQV